MQLLAEHCIQANHTPKVKIMDEQDHCDSYIYVPQCYISTFGVCIYSWFGSRYYYTNAYMHARLSSLLTPKKAAIMEPRNMRSIEG